MNAAMIFSCWVGDEPRKQKDRASSRGTKLGSLTVHVLDENQNPVPRKKVFCNFAAILPTQSEHYTDPDGITEFDGVPVGTVEVYVDERPQLKSRGRLRCPPRRDGDRRTTR
jgi:hypothetical protein